MTQNKTINSPVVSIVVTAYNMERYLNDALKSIAEQSYPNLDVIVVDDGSTDNTSDISKKYPFRYQYQENGGMSVAKNTGLNLSNGEYICFLDADDILLPERIRSQLEFLQDNPQIDLVFSDYQNFVDNDNFGSSHFQSCEKLSALLGDHAILSPREATRILADENFGICGSFMIRRRALKYVPFFNEALKSGDDFHFYFQVARRTSVGVLNQVCMLRRLHGSNMSGRPDKKLPARIKSYTMLRDSEEDLPTRKALKSNVSCFYTEYARHSANIGDYKKAFAYEYQAFRGDLSLKRTALSSRSVLRTSAMALGLHQSSE